MAEKLPPTEHGCDLAHRFDFHGGAGAAAVERVVVGIDLHGQGVGSARHRMRWLEHLPGEERMEVGEVVAEAAGRGLKHPRNCRLVDGGFGRRKAGKLIFERRKGIHKQARNGIVGHDDLSQ